MSRNDTLEPLQLHRSAYIADQKGEIMKLESAMPLRATLAAVALLFATLQPASGAEQDCPKGDLPVSATIEGRATTVGWIVGVRWGEGRASLRLNK